MSSVEELNEQEQKTLRTRRLAAFAFDWVGAMITAIMIPVVLFTLFIRIVTVDGASMQPTLQDADHLVLLTAVDTYDFGDIVVVNRYVQEPLVKRVIGISGDVLEITGDGVVYRNGTLLQEPYVNGKTFPNAAQGQIRVPDGYVFVMGDNRPLSKDSRSADVGLIPVADLIGKAMFRVWPLSSLGGIYDNLPEGGDPDAIN